MTSFVPLSADTSPVPSGPARVDIDLEAIAHNTEILLRAAGGAELMGVVKADAYGHGAPAVGRAVLDAGGSALGVTTLAEALELRQAGISAPVLAWLYSAGDDVSGALQAGIDLAIPSPLHLDAVLAGVRRSGLRAKVTPKLDTGLGRSGVLPAQWPEFLDRLVAAQRDGLIEVSGLMAHFANADSPGDPIIDTQVERLHEAVAEARAAGLECAVNHHSNAARTLTEGADGFEMVRPGIALYGLSPIEGEDFGLRPAMTFSAEILMVKDVPAGQGISYGHTWVAPRDTVVALVAAGYADGVWRLLSNKFSVEIGGRRYPQVGRVCMDQFMVDLGPRQPDGSVTGGVAAGDRAVMFGDPRRGAPHAGEWAETLGTIHYEVVCAARGRAARYVHSGRAPHPIGTGTGTGAGAATEDATGTDTATGGEG
ncbi:alanine racemase [Dietzia sp.]|uniref:alanine racemase n=1 Tax=Dietzia sp. TaxID=1871616 RepID=UPI002FD9AEEE